MRPHIAALRLGLRAGGLREAGRVEIIGHAANGNPDRLTAFAVDLATREVDVIVPVDRAALRTAKDATGAIPLVAQAIDCDPVEEGLVENPEQPGGTVTGVFVDFPEFGTAWLQILKQAIPGLEHAVVLHDAKASPIPMRHLEQAGQRLQVMVSRVDVHSAAELQQTFVEASNRRPHALIVLGSPLFNQRPEQIAELALAHRLPTATLLPEIARAGGLMAYGPDLAASFRQTGAMVARVLRGSPPDTLPIERPAKLALVVNRDTARTLGLDLPQSLVLGADEVIG